MTQICRRCGTLLRWVSAADAHERCRQYDCQNEPLETLTPDDPNVKRAELQDAIIDAGGLELLIKAKAGHPLAIAMLGAMGWHG